MDIQRTAKAPKFLLKVYNMLEEPSYHEAICWTEDGKSIEIKNEGLLKEKVLSNYFRHKNVASFIRQLNMYAFHRVNTEASNRMIYHMPLFQRGKKENLKLISRKKTVKEQIQQVSDITSLVGEMNKMKSKMADYDDKLSLMTSKNNHLEEENEMLRQAIGQAKERHSFLASKVQKIVLFLKALSDQNPNQLQGNTATLVKPLLTLTDQQPVKLLADLPTPPEKLKINDRNLFARTNSLVTRLQSSDRFLNSIKEAKTPPRKKTKLSKETITSPEIDINELPSMSEKIDEVNRKKELLPENSLAHYNSPSVPLIEGDDANNYFTFGRDIDDTFKEQKSIFERVNSLYNLGTQDLLNLPLPEELPLENIFDVVPDKKM